MRPSSWQLALLALSGLVEARAAPATVYIFDRRHDAPRRPDTSSITPKTARLLFAQWLGLSQYHSLGDADDVDLTPLNAYGSHQSILSGSTESRPERVRHLLLVDGVEDIEDHLPHDHKPSTLRMSKLPSPQHNEKLARALSQQLVHERNGRKGCTVQHEPSAEESSIFISATDGCCRSWLGRWAENATGLQDGLCETGRPGTASMLYFSDVTQLAWLKGYEGDAVQYSKATLSEMLDKFAKRAESGEQESIVVLFPPWKGAEQSMDPYGDYGITSTPSLAKRSSEEPLESAAAAASSPSSAATTTPKPSNPFSSNKNSTARRGFVPVCHGTLEACQAATGNCTGHGTCQKKYSFSASNAEDGKGKTKDCFACQCSPSVLRDSDTRVTTVHWGGNACQKQDISMPFFLLAGISIFIVAAVSWGIGLLFSVGQEQLPSVIGAGVAAPRPK